MRVGESTKMQAAINITPLVDVVLVLLIIFMVVAPQVMRKGPDVNLPDTAKPLDQGDERAKILVTIDEHGELWIDDQPVAAREFGEDLRAAAGGDPEIKVVIRGDARLHFSEVRQAMLAIEAAGFHGVGLIARRAGSKAEGDGDHAAQQ
jgi:biopolymer transport protein ExbD